MKNPLMTAALDLKGGEKMHTVFVSALNPAAAVFPGWVFPIFNPAAPATGLLTQTFGCGASHYTDSSRYRMMFPPPQFHVTPLHAAPAQNGGPLDRILPPSAGNGNGGSNGSGGNGKKNGAVNPYEAAMELRSMISESADSRELIEKMGSTLKVLGSVADQLIYIKEAVVLLNSIPFETFRFSPLELLSFAHHVSNMADELTGVVVPGGVTVHKGVNENEMLKPLFNFIVRLEQRLMNQKILTNDASIMIADIHFIYARKGLCAADDNMPAGQESPLKLALTVLHLLDITKRYDTAGLRNNSVRTRTFLEEIKSTYKIPSDARSWALAFYEEIMNSNLTALGALKDDPDIIEAAMHPLDAAINDFTRGLYLFSPGIFRYFANGLANAGFGQYAEQYARRAEEDLLTALRLGLTE
jgi:hypothetical protein